MESSVGCVLTNITIRCTRFFFSSQSNTI